MKIFTRLFIGVLISLASLVPAHAWSGPGHAAIAAMAYRQLPAEAQQQLTEILQSHPKFADWKKEFDTKKKSFPAKLDLGTFLFIRASTFPDDIRGTGSPFDHPNWHFVDYPIQQSDFSIGSPPVSPSPDDDVLFGIGDSLKTIQDSSATPEARAVSLSWVIHLIGDLHQPLHCATLINETTYPPPVGDRGGNKFFVSDLPKVKTRAVKLHTYWDQELGSNKTPDARTAFNDAVQLESEHPRASLPQLGTATDANAWSLESLDAAVKDAYQYEAKSHGTTQTKRLPGSADEHKGPPLPAGYSTQATQVARERISLAGYRLADTIQALKP